MKDIAISVHDISKCYSVFEDQRSRLLHAMWPNSTRGMQEIWALKDISFQVKRGEAVAIIGRNGGGKSTLLEILTGTLTPTTGEVKVNGRVSALLELGSGFNPEYSGKDNVILNGLLLGLSREDILSRFHEIEAFAEIGVAIDRPVKTYSSGMMMRLAFAVQVLCDPEILIIDEALSVGDFFFQQKCLRYLRGLRERGATFLLVSHNMDTVRTMCDRGIVLNRGVQIYSGDCTTAIRHYMQYGARNSPVQGNNEIGAGGGMNLVEKCSERLDSVRDAVLWRVDDIEEVVTKGGVLAVEVVDENEMLSMTATLGEKRIFRFHYCSPSGVPVRLECSIKDRFDKLVTSFGSMRLGFAPIDTEHPEYGIFEAEVELFLKGGEYSFNAAMIECPVESPHVGGTIIDATPVFGPITIGWDYLKDVAPFDGIAGLPVKGCLIQPFVI
jgi:lipopolysaccharide transport system ATP-binding protein